MLREARMEAHHGTWVGVLQCFDVDGRLLGEEHGKAPGQTELANTDWHEWGLGGSRQGRLYNATAMKAIARHWDDILADVQLLRDAYRRRFGGDDSLADLYYLSRIATSIPAFLMRRAAHPLRDGQLPVRQSALFKVMAGVHATIEHMIGHGPPAGLFEDPEPQRLVGYIEEHTLFVAASGRVCSGPEKMVRALFANAIGRAAPRRPAAEPPAFASDLEAILDYGVGCAKIELGAVLLGRGLAGDTGPDRCTAAGLAFGARLFDHLDLPVEVSAADFLLPSSIDPGAELLTALRGEFGFDAARAHTQARVLRLCATAHRGVVRLSPYVLGLLGRAGAEIPSWEHLAMRARKTLPSYDPESGSEANIGKDGPRLVQRGLNLRLRRPRAGDSLAILGP